MPYSPAASGMRCSRRSSLRACSSTSSGMPALVIALSSSAISAALPSSPSPSWRWMAAICSRSSASRWRSSSAALVCRPISCDSRSTSIRCASRRETLSMRADDVDRLEDLLLLVRLDVHVGGGEVGQRGRRRRSDWTAASSSGGACGSSCRASSACAFRLTKRASISAERSSGSSMRSTRATKNGRRGEIPRSGSAARPGRSNDACRPAR